MWIPSLSNFCPSCISQWLPGSALENDTAATENATENTNCFDKVWRAASIVLTSCVLVCTYGINPTMVGTAFLIGLFSHDRIYYVIRAEFLEPIQNHPYVTFLALLISAMIDPRFALMAGSIIFAAYCGSAIHVNDNQDVALANRNTERIG